MTTFLICLLLLLGLPNTSLSATSITQYGITWTFDTNYTTGQFINGDYWVIDSGNGVKIINISPGHSTHPTTGKAINGSMINPVDRFL